MSFIYCEWLWGDWAHRDPRLRIERIRTSHSPGTYILYMKWVILSHEDITNYADTFDISFLSIHGILVLRFGVFGVRCVRLVQMIFFFSYMRLHIWYLNLCRKSCTTARAASERRIHTFQFPQLCCATLVRRYNLHSFFPYTSGKRAVSVSLSAVLRSGYMV